MKKGISFLVVATLIVVLSSLSIDAFSQTDQQSENYVTGITSGRARSLIGVVFGLTSLIIGLKGKTRKRKWVITALALGLIAVMLSVVHLLNLTGGFGTGGGKAGAIVALALGFLAS